jgi:hypothetical protein
MGVVNPLEVVDIGHHEVRGRRPARARRDRQQLQIERAAVRQPGERIRQGVVHRATQLPAQPGQLRRAPAQLCLEPANLGRELAVLVDAGAEQLLQLLGSRGHGDARLMRRGLRAAGMRLPVTANECFSDPSDQPATPVAERWLGVGLRQVPGHSEALPRQAVDSGGATTRGRNP